MYSVHFPAYDMSETLGEMPQSRSRSPVLWSSQKFPWGKKSGLKTCQVLWVCRYHRRYQWVSSVLSDLPTSSSPLQKRATEEQEEGGRDVPLLPGGSATAGPEGMRESSILNQIWSFDHDGLSLDATSYWTEIVFLSFLFFDFLSDQKIMKLPKFLCWAGEEYPHWAILKISWETKIKSLLWSSPHESCLYNMTCFFHFQ